MRNKKNYSNIKKINIRRDISTLNPLKRPLYRFQTKIKQKLKIQSINSIPQRINIEYQALNPKQHEISIQSINTKP